MLVLQAAYNSTLNRPPCPQSRTWCIRSLPGREVPTHIPTQLANQERKHGLGQAEAPSQHDSDPAYFRRQRLTWLPTNYALVYKLARAAACRAYRGTELCNPFYGIRSKPF